MKCIKIEIIENGNKKPEKYTFLGSKCGEQAAKLFNTKFAISVIDMEEVKK